MNLHVHVLLWFSESELRRVAEIGCHVLRTSIRFRGTPVGSGFSFSCENVFWRKQQRTRGESSITKELTPGVHHKTFACVAHSRL